MQPLHPATVGGITGVQALVLLLILSATLALTGRYAESLLRISSLGTGTAIGGGFVTSTTESGTSGVINDVSVKPGVSVRELVVKSA